MRLLIVYPTRGRKKLFFQTMDNLESTIGSSNYEVIINIDSDDLEMNNVETIQTIINNYYNCKVFVNERISKVSACNANIDKIKSWQWCLLMSDDQKFVVNGWYEKMVFDIKQIWGDSLDFFAHFSDNFVCEKLPTLNVCGVGYYRRFNYLYHNSYGSISCDSENFFVSQMLGRHHYFPQVYFHHLHPSNLGTATDSVYLDNDRFGQLDTDNYFNRMKKYFDVPESDRVCIPEQLQKEIDNLR